MKKSAVKESLRYYRKNFSDLLLALLVELVLRGIALTPLLFLADAALAPLAWLTVPAYLLIALPARQNYALALQDMLSGGRVFSLRLLETDHYGGKLWNGLKGSFFMLLWSSLTLAGIGLLYAGWKHLPNFVALLEVFKNIGSNFSQQADQAFTGVLATGAALGASLLLPVLGCAVHSGVRHARALGCKKLIKGCRMRLIGLWFAGLLTVVPYGAVAACTLSGYMGTILAAVKKLEFPTLTLTLPQTAILIGGLALLLPLLPLKNLLPAVFLRLEKEKTYAAP